MKRKTLFTLLLILVIVFLCLYLNIMENRQTSLQPNDGYEKIVVIIRLKDDYKINEKDLKENDIEIINYLDLTNTIIAEIPKEELNSIKKLEFVETISENQTISIN